MFHSTPRTHMHMHTHASVHGTCAWQPVVSLVRSPVVCGRRSWVWCSGLWARQVQGRRGGRPRIKSDGVRWRREGGSACPAVGWGGGTTGLGDSPAVSPFLCPREQPSDC